ncbi:MAG: GNAT family N-acetyltransferase [Flavobacteriaceae bacterium]|nr:GNAT family N-acetyltransferase [Flavobacteriaceae bacterium]
MISKVNTASHIETTARLAHKIWTEHYVPIIGQEQVNYMLKNIQSIEAITEQMKSGYEYYLLRDDSIEIGYLALRPNHPQGKIMISKIYIDTSQRGRGYGNQLLEFTQKISLKRGIEFIWLTVNRHNSNTINWYEKKGFSIVKEKKSDIGNGFIMDDYVLEVAANDLVL